MAEVLWSLRAARNLREIREFIAADSTTYADSFADGLAASTEILRESPRAGRVVPEVGRNEIRELIFRGYRILYSVESDKVTVLMILHGAQDLRRLLRRERWLLG